MHVRKGELSPGNTQLVARAAALAASLDLQVADVNQARVQLQLPSVIGP